jgi:hypothetical protein
VRSPSQTLLITSAKEIDKEKKREGGQRREDTLRARNEFPTGVAEPIVPLALFFPFFVCFFAQTASIFLHRVGANRGKTTSEN